MDQREDDARWLAAQTEARQRDARVQQKLEAVHKTLRTVEVIVLALLALLAQWMWRHA